MARDTGCIHQAMVTAYPKAWRCERAWHVPKAPGSFQSRWVDTKVRTGRRRKRRGEEEKKEEEDEDEEEEEVVRVRNHSFRYRRFEVKG